MTKRAYHNPRGNPCGCGVPNHRHRVEHKPQGEPCAKCGLLEEAHYKTNVKPAWYYIGMDGESQGRDDHRYMLLAWSNESGSLSAYVEADKGKALTTEQCLDFILDTPQNSKAFAYAFNYDLTKILTDVDDETLYRLFRPELRKRKAGYEKYGPKPVQWGAYSLNLQGTKFTVKRANRRVVVWDTFKFYQAKFTTALEDWFKKELDYDDVIKPDIERMRLMKDKRAEFDKLGRKEILGYCLSECRYMARLTRKLVDAHTDAGLKLKSFHGAGSTASCILKGMGIDKCKRSTPEDMLLEVASGFFGGRFENSEIGDLKGPIWGYDLSGAYLYELTFLPCLDCGVWKRTTKRNDLDGTRQALVRYTLDKAPRNVSWGPFPFRLTTGSIAFPSTSGGGWVYKDEYLQGEKYFSQVRFVEAWVYDCNCNHIPFNMIPHYYRERLRIGKEGAGMVFKFGPNAAYGKLAQSLGLNPPFQCWIWAGMITSGTRAKMLELYGMHENKANLLMIATDGAYSREKLIGPPPRNTDTMTIHKKPLGGWERKVIEKGMFAARPGVYFPTDPTEEEIKEVRARGVGRAVMLANWRVAVQAWRNGEPGVRISDVSRFHGAKSSISRARDPQIPGHYLYHRGLLLDDEGEPWINPLTGKPKTRYGQWSSRPVDMTFNPLPKRSHARKDGTLAVRQFPSNMISIPYDKAIKSDEAIQLRLAQTELSEQPDGEDFSDYEDEM